MHNPISYSAANFFVLKLRLSVCLSVCLKAQLLRCQESNAPVYDSFRDFKRVFDSMHGNTLWCMLKHYGISVKIMSIIKLLYSYAKSSVICVNYLSEVFPIYLVLNKGV